MKRLLKNIGLWVIAVCVLTQLSGAVPVYAADAEPRTVRVGVYDNFPKIYKDTDGTIQGFWADITDEIARREQWDVIYVHDTWENNLSRLERGEIDIMVDVAVSDERDIRYDFNQESVLLSWGLFYTRKGVVLESIADLEGKRIAALKSGILYSGTLGLKDILETSALHAEVIDVTVYEDVFALLDRGEADVGVVSWYFGFANEGRYNVTRTGILFRPSELRYAFPAGAPANEQLISAVDTQVRQMKEETEGVYHRSIQRHFGGFIEKQEVLPSWARYLLFALGGLFILATVNTLILRRYKKLLERQVEEHVEELKFRNLILSTEQEAMMDGILVVDEIGKILNTNKRFVEMWSVPDDIITSKLDERLLQHSLGKLREPEKSFSRIRYIYDHRNETSQDELLLKDGRVFDRYSAPMLDQDGKYFGRVWFFRDVSELKKAGADLTSALARNAELQAARGEFISLAAHQLRSPLSVMLGYASIFRDEAMTDRQKEAVAAIENSVKEMNQLINFLQKITQAESGKMQLEITSLDMKERTEHVLKMMEGELTAKHQRVEITQNPASLPRVLLDKDIVGQVLQNLLQNASRYSPDGSTIRIAISLAGDHLEYAVTDTGIGIPKDAIPKIFDKFFRAENARKLSPEGTGLGLPLVKSFVEAWGGTVRCDSVENQGTTCTVTIPMS